MSDVEHALETIKEAVLQAYRRGVPLKITGGASKLFYGRTISGQVLSTLDFGGIISYEPTELVITARAGTPMTQIEAALMEHGQMLPFEPPHFGSTATLGGTVACGLAGPRRAYAGAVRDFVLGITCLNGKGEILRFGGQVMKNVAGYDISRLLVGALGTLGIILEVSLKVLPKPPVEITLRHEVNPAQAIHLMNRWATLPLPLSATCHYAGELYTRVAGVGEVTASVHKQLGGELVDQRHSFWTHLKEQQLAFFRSDKPLWRLSVPPATEVLTLGDSCLMEWGGAQRWFNSSMSEQKIREAAVAAGGHAVLFRGGSRSQKGDQESRQERDVFHPLPKGMNALHRRIKNAFDPKRILNSGKMYRGI